MLLVYHLILSLCMVSKELQTTLRSWQDNWDFLGLYWVAMTGKYEIRGKDPAEHDIKYLT